MEKLRYQDLSGDALYYLLAMEAVPTHLIQRVRKDAEARWKWKYGDLTPRTSIPMDWEIELISQILKKGWFAILNMKFSPITVEIIS